MDWQALPCTNGHQKTHCPWRQQMPFHSLQSATWFPHGCQTTLQPLWKKKIFKYYFQRSHVLRIFLCRNSDKDFKCWYYTSIIVVTTLFGIAITPSNISVHSWVSIRFVATQNWFKSTMITIDRTLSVPQRALRTMSYTY